MSRSLGSSFNGAATFQSRKRAPPEDKPRASNPFNGAATFQSRKLARLRGVHRPGRPSMEPRPFSRGNSTTNCKIPSSNFLQWSRDLSVAETSGGCEGFDRTVFLQWSRDLSVAETCPECEAPVVPEPPSMEPRPFSRGNVTRKSWMIGIEMCLQWSRDLSVAETTRPASSCTGQLAFNGAATFQSRKPGPPQDTYPRPHPFNGAATFQSRKPGKRIAQLMLFRCPSMEPRPFSRGNVTAGGINVLPVYSLQWSRDLSVAETARPLR